MDRETIIVLDCGATNIRAVAIDENGIVLEQRSYRNSTHEDPYLKGGLIWDIDEIWSKMVKAIKHVLQNIDINQLVAITVTTFGVDGAPMNKKGDLLYPVISWACQRTAPVLDHIDKYIPIKRLYELSGVNKFSFNTINKLIWFKENKPEILDQMDHFVFMPSIFIHKLTGQFITDTSMAGTSMMTNIRTRQFSDEILDAIGIENKFPTLVEAGNIAGHISANASIETGIPEGLPVVACGHDTQFAVQGSGIKENEVVLSSGTWEILMARVSEINISSELLPKGVTVELDALPHLYNPGMQWLGSGILEWIKDTFYYHESRQENIYNLMMKEAEHANARGIKMNIDFLNMNGGLHGLGVNSSRADIYRAALEALSLKTLNSLRILEEAAGFKASNITVVGGGSKNSLWNQLREECLGIPVKTVSQTETTVLGASQIAFSGLNK